MYTRFFTFLFLSIIVISTSLAEDRWITKEVLLDKLHGFWIGQMAGNYMGFPFENVYVDEPVPVLVDRIYTWKDASENLRLNNRDHRGFFPIVAGLLEGVPSDDDTDIELVTLYAVEQYGLDITHEEIGEMWKTHINRRIWVANRTARNLMSQGFTPPDTGRKEYNENWFQIDPQLVNEIWGAFYPGMTEMAAYRSKWGAQITNDDWGIHPTVAYGVMYSAAFFEDDVNQLVKMAFEAIPHKGPFYEGMKDVMKWCKENEDWRVTRQMIHDKYYRYEKDGVKAPVSVVSSLCNGLCGIMAILYGQGDFMQTVGIATSAGYDCDNQAATCAGLIGVLQGQNAVPDHLTKNMDGIDWELPFNNRYLNHSRDNLPYEHKISDMVYRTLDVCIEAIYKAGGKKGIIDGEEAFLIRCDF